MRVAAAFSLIERARVRALIWVQEWGIILFLVVGFWFILYIYKDFWSYWHYTSTQRLPYWWISPSLLECSSNDPEACWSVPEFHLFFLVQWIVWGSTSHDYRFQWDLNGTADWRYIVRRCHFTHSKIKISLQGYYTSRSLKYSVWLSTRCTVPTDLAEGAPDNPAR